MRLRPFVYTICSAFLFLISFYTPLVAPVAMLASLTIIFVMQHKERSLWKYGALWGFLVFTVHLFWLLCVLMTYFGMVKAIGFWALLIVWLVSVSIVWWHSLYQNILHHALITILFFVFIAEYCFVFFGWPYGYPLFWPGIVFNTQYPDVMCIILIGTASILAHYLFLKKWQMVLGVCTLFCGVVLLLDRKINHQALLSAHVLIPLQFSDGIFAGYRIMDQLSDYLFEPLPVIMPESSFPFNLNDYDQFVSMWSYGIKNLILGTHIKNHNVFCWIKDGTIIHQYAKKHILPIVECCSYDVGCDGDLIMIQDNLYQIFLCSELFFKAKLIRSKNILFLYNDTWLIFDWIQNIAVLFIQYFERKYGVSIYFVSRSGRTNICKNLKFDTLLKT